MRATFPCSQRRGGSDINKIVAKLPLTERTGWSDRQNFEFRRADYPVCMNKVAARLLIDRAASPPLRGGEFMQHIKGIVFIFALLFAQASFAADFSLIDAIQKGDHQAV